jgi:pyruvate/2-oxoglutarate/acetoin dehydrogenase E1 component
MKKYFFLEKILAFTAELFVHIRGFLIHLALKGLSNTPISEQAIVGSAVGAAITGYRPVAELMFVDFAALAMDQIVNQAAKIKYMTGDALNVPMVLRTQGGAGRGIAAQHSQSLEAWFYHVPGLKVVMPSTHMMSKAF